MKQVTPPPASRILVIKLGALGDFVLATGPFAAIRATYPEAHITLLTTAPLAGFAQSAPWFDRVWTDSRPSGLDVGEWLELRRRLRSGRFDLVFDLQTADRTGWYFRLMWPRRPLWSGIVRGCSHRHANPRRDRLHTLDRHAEQLAAAGIQSVPPPDLSWAKADLSRFDLPRHFVVLAPGGAAHRPAKRWPVDRFGALAARIAIAGPVPVVIGSAAEADLAAAIQRTCPVARDLTGRTDLMALAALCSAADAAVGNDTGPMHVAAATGVRSVVLFSGESDPALTAPRGPTVKVVRRDPLRALPVAEVAAALSLR